MSNQDVPPIWQRFREVFLYALHPAPLGVAFCIGVVFAWFEPGLLLSIPLLFIGLRYAVEVFGKTASGDLKPPKITYSLLVDDYELTIKLFFLLFLILLLVGSISGSVAPVVGLMVWYFFLLALPASYMTVMLTGSMLHGINPVALVQMIAAMGWSYWLLYGLLFILSTAWTNLTGLLSALPNAALFVILFYMTFFAFNVMAFHMMGYMIFRRGDVFGTVSEQAFAEPTPFSLFDELLEKGHSDAARVELKRLIKESPGDLVLYRRMHNLALVDQAAADLAENARMAIPRLIAERRTGEAAEIYRDCLRAEAMPKRLSAEDSLTLAVQLRAMSHSREAFDLLNGFHKRYPHSHQVFDAYWLAAKVLSEDLNRDDLALRMLTYLGKHFTQHEQIDEVNRYRQVLESLATT